MSFVEMVMERGARARPQSLSVARVQQRTGAILSLCAGALRKLNCAGFVRWCNGSTRPFGGLCPGSNPGRTASLPSRRNVESLNRMIEEVPPRIAVRALQPRMGMAVACFLLGVLSVLLSLVLVGIIFAVAGLVLGLW